MAVTLASALNTALRAHKAGQLDLAIATYDAILAIQPDHATARHLRGFARLQLGRLGEALADLREAVRLSPANANAWCHLAVALGRVGASALAVVAARRAQLLSPDLPDALDAAAADPATAKHSAARLLIVAPANPNAWNRAGVVRAAGDPAAARRALRRASILAPSEAPALLDLADLERRNRNAGAADRLATRGVILRPLDPRARAERAAAATELDAVSDALADTAHALLLDPGHVRAWGNRAETLYRMARYPAAVATGGRALLGAPDDADVRANLGAYRLAAGDLPGGWALFRDRPARRQTVRRDLPRWAGQTGARLLVLAEQGLGDELLFSSMWRDLDDRVTDGRLASATVEADRRLVPLGARACPRLSWRPRGESSGIADDYTHWCLAGDLMESLRPTADSFPGTGAGLVPAAPAVDQWRNWVAETAVGRPAIGICWRSGSLAGHRQRHYPQIGECAPLLALEDKLFVVLQYDECGDEIASTVPGPGSHWALPPDLDRRDDQEGVAALMTALDLVVSADTAVLALAGALRVPALGFALHPGWVGLGRPDHPWFPTVQRIYRAPDVPWIDALERVAARVEEMWGRGVV